MRDLADIVQAVEYVAGAKRRSLRTERLNELLAGKLDPVTPQGRALLHRRALLITELRIQDVWP